MSDLRSVERARSVAVESQHLSEAHVHRRLDALSALRGELTALMP